VIRSSLGRVLVGGVLLVLASGCAAGDHVVAGDVAPGDSLPPSLAGELPYRLDLERVIGAYGSGPGQMAYPEGVAVDDLGRLFVSDTGNNRVLRFDQAGIFLGEFGGFGFDEGRFDKPRDLFVAGGLALYVLDAENARVVRYDLNGRLDGTVVDFESQDARIELGPVRPGGLAGEATGYLYVSDLTSDRLIVLNPLAGGWTPVGGYGSQQGRFRHPTGMAVSARGTVIVGDGGNARLQALDSFGGYLRSFPLADVSRTGRVGVAVLPGGALAACESEFSRLTVFSSDGKLVARLTTRGSRPGELDGPSALAVDRSGRLYVADTQNHRVQVFRVVDRSTPRGR